MSNKIKPFADIKTNYTLVHNYCFDVCMPNLSNAGLRILFVAVRKTLGWQDKTSDTGRKEEDEISYSQFQEASGLKSPASVSKGIKENLAARYLVRRRVGYHQGTKAPLYAYRLNEDYEVTTTESVAAEADHKTSTTETVVAATSKGESAATTESVETKVKEKATGKEKDQDVLASLWSPVLDAAQGVMTKATFDTWLRGSRLIGAENGTWTVAVAGEYAAEWLEKRIAPSKSFQNVLQAYAPAVTEIKFVPRS